MLLHKSAEFDSRVQREASALAHAGYEVTVLELAEIPPGSDGDFARRSVLPPRWLRRVLPFHLYRIGFLVAFVRAIVRLRPDIIHAHDSAMLLPAAAGRLLVGARVVYDSHELATSVPYRERTWALFVRGIEQLVVPRCAAVITVSEGIATRLQALYRLPRRPSVVRNVSALAVEGQGRLRETLGLGAEVPLVLHQGAPAPSRGGEVLVRAMVQLPGVHLVFMGDPEPGYGAVLHDHVVKLGLTDRVTMLPSVSLSELLAYTAEADVGVTLLQDTCENHRLALPNKLFEYVAAGIPVVAAALPESRELVERYGIGWTVPPSDHLALAEALQSAIEARRSDSELRARVAEAARELRWSREQERLLSVYAALSG